MKSTVGQIAMIVFLLFCGYAVISSGRKRDRTSYERIVELQKQEADNPNIKRVTVYDETGSRRTYIGEMEILDDGQIVLDGVMESCEIIYRN